MPRSRRTPALLGALLLAHLLIASTSQAQVVSFATLKPGSLYHTMGTVIAKLITEKTNIRMLVQPYGSGAAGMFAVNQGDASFVFSDVNDAIFAVGGRGIYKGRATPNLRLAARIRAVPVGLFVRKNSSIRTMRDFRGKRLPARYPAFPNAIALINGILAASGMTYADVVKIPTPSLIPAVNDFMAGKMDAGFFAVSGPKVAEANQSVGGVRFIPVPNTPSALAAMRKIRPEYYIQTVQPAPFRPGIVGPTPLLTFDQVIGVGKDVPDRIVYTVLKTIAENKKALVAGFKGFGGFIPQRMGKTFSGLEHHPAAVKLLRDKGYWKN